MLRGLLVSRLLVSLAADDGLDALARGVHNSWVLELSPDPEQAAHGPNRAAREVRSGHWVGVRPAALPDPALVSLSAETAVILLRVFRSTRTHRSRAPHVHPIAQDSTSTCTYYSHTIHDA